MSMSAEDLGALDPAWLAAFKAREDWLRIARQKQIPPPGDWTQLIWKAGRGFGKTKAEVEALFWDGWRVGQPLILHAVGPTLGDVKGTLMKGVSGFQAVVPAECLYKSSWEEAYVESPQPILTLANGTIIKGYGAVEQAGRLRGPQCHAACGDELREWDRPAGNLQAAHSNLMLGVRLPWPDGSPARAYFGTTPKSIPYLKGLYKRSDVKVVTGTTYENLTNLNPSFTSTILSMEGTRAGKAEIYGEDTEDEDGIFKKSWIRLWPPFKKLPDFVYILMSIDAAAEEEHFKDVKKGKEPDYSACSMLGVFNVAQVFTEEERKKLRIKSKYAALLCDFWMERLPFPEMLEKARATYRTKWGKPGRKPDLVLIEQASSGIALRQTLMSFGVPTWKFQADVSKTLRANMVAPLVLQGMFFVPESGREDRKGQVRDWAEPLTDQMTQFAGEGTIEYDDGLDTIVQGLLYLQQRGFFHAEPQGRGFPDRDEKDEAEKREAVEIAKREKRQKAGNPYDA